MNKYYATIGYPGGTFETEITEWQYEFQRNYEFDFMRHFSLDVPDGKLYLNRGNNFIKFRKEESK